MATIPTVPTFASNDSSLTNLQNLSAAVAFLIDCDIRPAWHLYRTLVGSETANTWVVSAYATIASDSDGVSDGTGALIVTQGYYRCEANVNFLTGTTASEESYGAFLLTGGTHNPHISSGTTLRFGLRGGGNNVIASIDTCFCLSALSPFCLYPGDTVRVEGYGTQANSLNWNTASSYMSGHFSANFTGYYVCTGT